MEFQYYWMHIPSGRSGSNTTQHLKVHGRYGQYGLLELLNKWNRIGRGQWIYWTDEE